MTKADLTRFIKERTSYLCIGLDTDPLRIPEHLRSEPDPIFTFNKAIIDATHDLCVAYKPNIAFYEALGPAGWHALEKTLEYIPDTHFTIADAKRGDIGNTSRMYARAFFSTLDFDAVTVAPYMGIDSVSPFLEFEDKWVGLLGLTSNTGSSDFQMIRDADGQALYQRVLTTAQTWGTPDNLMFVIGATHPERIAEVRALAPESFFLVPGVGAQGGDLEAVIQHGRTADGGGLLINSSRGIIYAGTDRDFAKDARKAAFTLQQQMSNFF